MPGFPSIDDPAGDNGMDSVQEQFREPWAYLAKRPKRDAPVSDNPSDMYCPECRAAGFCHCSEPEYCGGMRLMKKAES